MATAFAFQKVAPAIEYIRLDTEVATAEGDHTFLLDAVRALTRTQVAAVYAYREECSELRGIAARSNVATRVKAASLTISAPMSKWIESLDGSVQCGPEERGYLERFPEALQYDLKVLAVLPLRSNEGLLGLLTLGRVEKQDFDAQAIAAGERAASLLTAVLERDSLRHKLLERKVVERAKGILQRQSRLTEEQAYLTLRNDSRRRRITMAEVAKEIIEAHTEHQTLRRLQAH